MNDTMGHLTTILVWMVVVEVLVVVVNLLLAITVEKLRRDMNRTNDALVSIVKTGVVVNAVLALVQTAYQRRKPPDQYDR